jgi:hypothetical protein
VGELRVKAFQGCLAVNRHGIGSPLAGRPGSPRRGPARDAQCSHERRSITRGEAPRAHLVEPRSEVGFYEISRSRQNWDDEPAFFNGATAWPRRSSTRLPLRRVLSSTLMAEAIIPETRRMRRACCLSWGRLHRPRCLPTSSCDAHHREAGPARPQRGVHRETNGQRRRVRRRRLPTGEPIYPPHPLCDRAEEERRSVRFMAVTPRRVGPLRGLRRRHAAPGLSVTLLNEAIWGPVPDGI